MRTKLRGSDAAGAHGGDFGVGGEAAEAEQDAGEDGGGNGDGEGVGQHVAEDAQGVGERGGVADQQIDDLGKSRMNSTKVKRTPPSRA